MYNARIFWMDGSYEDGLQLRSCDEETFIRDCPDGVLKIPSVFLGAPVTRRNANFCAIWKSLRRVEIGDGVRSIGVGAFANCPNLESVRLGSTINEIGGGAFVNMKEEGHVSGARCSISVWDGTTFSFMYSKLFSYFGNAKQFVIPDLVEEIEPYAFAGSNTLEEIVVPSSVVKIGNHAFSNCANLKRVILHEGISRLPDGLFLGCASLESVEHYPFLQQVGVACFAGCRSLAEVTVKPYACIGGGAFSGFTGRLIRFGVRKRYEMEDDLIYDEFGNIVSCLGDHTEYHFSRRPEIIFSHAYYGQSELHRI